MANKNSNKTSVNSAPKDLEIDIPVYIHTYNAFISAFRWGGGNAPLLFSINKNYDDDFQSEFGALWRNIFVAESLSAINPDNIYIHVSRHGDNVDAPNTQNDSDRRMYYNSLNQYDRIGDKSAELSYLFWIKLISDFYKFKIQDSISIITDILSANLNEFYSKALIYSKMQAPLEPDSKQIQQLFQSLIAQWVESLEPNKDDVRQYRFVKASRLSSQPQQLNKTSPTHYEDTCSVISTQLLKQIISCLDIGVTDTDTTHLLEKIKYANIANCVQKILGSFLGSELHDTINIEFLDTMQRMFRGMELNLNEFSGVALSGGYQRLFASQPLRQSQTEEPNTILQATTSSTQHKNGNISDTLDNNKPNSKTAYHEQGVCSVAFLSPPDVHNNDIDAKDVIQQILSGKFFTTETQALFAWKQLIGAMDLFAKNVKFMFQYFGVPEIDVQTTHYTIRAMPRYIIPDKHKTLSEDMIRMVNLLKLIKAIPLIFITALNLQNKAHTSVFKRLFESFYRLHTRLGKIVSQTLQDENAEIPPDSIAELFKDFSGLIRQIDSIFQELGELNVCVIKPDENSSPVNWQYIYKVNIKHILSKVLSAENSLNNLKLLLLNNNQADIYIPRNSTRFLWHINMIFETWFKHTLKRTSHNITELSGKSQQTDVSTHTVDFDRVRQYPNVINVRQLYLSELNKNVALLLNTSRENKASAQTSTFDVLSFDFWGSALLHDLQLASSLISFDLVRDNVQKILLRQGWYASLRALFFENEIRYSNVSAILLNQSPYTELAFLLWPYFTMPNKRYYRFEDSLISRPSILGNLNYIVRHLTNQGYHDAHDTHSEPNSFKQEPEVLSYQSNDGLASANLALENATTKAVAATRKVQDTHNQASNITAEHASINAHISVIQSQGSVLLPYSKVLNSSDTVEITGTFMNHKPDAILIPTVSPFTLNDDGYNLLALKHNIIVTQALTPLGEVQHPSYLINETNLHRVSLLYRLTTGVLPNDATLSILSHIGNKRGLEILTNGIIKGQITIDDIAGLYPEAIKDLINYSFGKVQRVHRFKDAFTAFLVFLLLIPEDYIYKLEHLVPAFISNDTSISFLQVALKAAKQVLITRAQSITPEERSAIIENVATKTQKASKPFLDNARELIISLLRLPEFLHSVKDRPLQDIVNLAFLAQANDDELRQEVLDILHSDKPSQVKYQKIMDILTPRIGQDDIRDLIIYLASEAKNSMASFVNAYPYNFNYQLFSATEFAHIRKIIQHVNKTYSYRLDDILLPIQKIFGDASMILDGDDEDGDSLKALFTVLTHPVRKIDMESWAHLQRLGLTYSVNYGDLRKSTPSEDDMNALTKCCGHIFV